MSWHLYSLTFRLKSPLHIGFHKVMHLFRTRTYVPAKPFWGALTAKLARRLKSSNYREVGEFLKNTMRFGYFYLFDGNSVFIPKYTDEGLKFGNLPKIEFEKRFISSQTFTSIEPYSFTAEEGTLHEVEFINPYEIHEKPKPVFLRGLLWVSDSFEDKLTIQIDKNDFLITNGKTEVMFSNLVNTLQVGGERKYGFGQLKLEEDGLKKVNDKDLEHLGFSGKWENIDDTVKLKLEKGNFIWSHVKYNPNLKIKGLLEPVVGRDWSTKGAGRELTSHGLCWVPGSEILEDVEFEITKEFGIWKMVEETQKSILCRR